MNHRKVLFVSPTQPIGGCSANVHTWDKPPTWGRIAVSFLNHPGLSFLKANLPCDILEYPTPRQFTDALADPPDVLGISFYINETEVALRMAAEARRAGVGEIWAGNFGAYSPLVRGAFDRVFEGWSEGTVAAALDLPPIPPDRIRHPEMYNAVGTSLFPRMLLAGILFTARGCPWSCNFCQTPGFYGKAGPLPLETIDQVLWTYRQRGVTAINILDESFGAFPQHAREVIEMLHRYGMRWVALTRVDTLLRYFDEWSERGLFGAHLGIESLSQQSLEAATKRLDQTDTVRLLERMSRHNLFVQAFYMIGFETDTVASVRRDIESLARLDVDVVQVQVLTPFPRTGQTEFISGRYGIHDQNLSRYNARHLVWNHPHIAPEEMRALQRWANARLATPRRALRTLAKIFLFGGRPRPGLENLRYLTRSLQGPIRQLHRLYATRLASARRWARLGGLVPYEELPPAVAREAGGR